MGLTTEDFNVLEGHKNKVIVTAFALLGTPLGMSLAGKDLDEKIAFVENLLLEFEEAQQKDK